MRLLHHAEDGGLQLTQLEDPEEEPLPRYAVLSHTWRANNEDEVRYEDLMQGKAATIKPTAFKKIRLCGNQAAKHGLQYFWVDTCCIDQSSSADVSEAICRMFAWYRNAARCYVYLADVSVPEAPVTNKASWEMSFRHSRWFTRGWTLQELLAPASVEFFSSEWTRLGDKVSLRQWIHEITRIPHGALQGQDLASFSIEERMSWANGRQTKRKEDMAYCLLGIFNIFMPTMYGEGGEHALNRLHQKLNKKHTDMIKLDACLATLPVASEAAFNSLVNQHAPTCLQDTRVELLQEITKWVEQPGQEQACIFWLSGMAGYGKSTVARTIARTYHDQGNLGASFFFSRGVGDLSNSNKLMTTLARQLANSVPETRRFICEAIVEQHDIAGRSLRDQWEQLVLIPLSRLKNNSYTPPIVLVIDALDECDDEQDVRIILQALATAASLTSIRLRILITSRPETPIRHFFQKMTESERQVFVLHDVAPTLVDQDLSLFFENYFSTFREEHESDDDWPGSKIIKRLVEMSSGLFIWASTACRFICEGKRLAFATKRLRVLLSLGAAPDLGMGPQQLLDQIYITVLRESVSQYSVRERKEWHDILNEVLGTIVTLFSPLPVDSLAALLDTKLGYIKETLADLHTILHIPSQTSRTIRIHHPSFRDFILDPDRCSDLDFWVDGKQAHRAVADSCIMVMSKMLKRDICELKLPGKQVKSIDPGVIKQRISPELEYACTYWAQHYLESGTHLFDGDHVHQFLQEFFLYWLETMSLIGRSMETVSIMRLYQSLLKYDDNVCQLFFVKDARRLLFTFHSIIKQAPLQTYCAALTFLPTNNRLRHSFRRQMHPWIRDVRIVQPYAHKIKDESNYVNDLSFTPDGNQIASGSSREVTRLWDVATRAAVYKFEGPTDKISSVAISPDGTLLAGGSDDSTAWIWDVKTKAVRHTLKAHSRWVNSVFFSPDGKLIVSGSMDGTLALWDPVTGTLIKVLDNQSSCVNSAAFSPNGSIIATGSTDRLVRLWEIWSSTEEGPRKVLEGHSGCVNSVKFSPNGKALVSGSDDTTVKLWNLERECKTLRGHTKRVMAVTFSLDARLIVSGSEDKTIRIWAEGSGAALHTLRDHTSGINAVLFSPNGQLLASGSFDDEVRLWNAKTWTHLGVFEEFEDDVATGSAIAQHMNDLVLDSRMANTEPKVISAAKGDYKGHSGSVTHVKFSKDGQLLASGSQDTTIKLWSREGVERWRLDGHSDVINGLAFSPDSHRLASASADKTVKVWDMTTGLELCTLEGHSEEVYNVSFSPDGRLVASYSADRTIKLWDTSTGSILDTLEGHSEMINDMAFSPDSRLMASCSMDADILVWNLVTKSISTLQGHTGSVNCIAFSSDGELLVSCSEDASIRLWTSDGESFAVIDSDMLPCKSVSFATGRRLVASCSANGTVQLWDVKTKSPCGSSFEAGIALGKISYSDFGRYLETDRGNLDMKMFGLDASLYSSLSASLSLGSLFVTQSWVKKGIENAIWLPSEYHASCVATHEDLVVLGHSCGGLSFIVIAMDQKKGE